MNVKPGNLVRVITTVGNNPPRVRYAHVLAVAPLTEELIGANGEPTISVAYIDEPNLARLGKVDWHQAFERQVGVPHISHPTVTTLHVATFWVDALPAAGEDIDMGAVYGASPSVVNNDPSPDPALPGEQALEQTQQASTAAADSTPVKTKLYIVDGVGAPDTTFSGDFTVDVERAARPSSLVDMRDLEVGDELPHFGLKVVGIAPETPEGVTRILTEPIPGGLAESEQEQYADETKQYADGSSATGPAPLPNQSPAEQAADENVADTEVAAL